MFAAFEKRRVGGEVEFALEFAGVMAARAAPFQDRHHVVVIAQRLGIVPQT